MNRLPRTLIACLCLGAMGAFAAGAQHGVHDHAAHDAAGPQPTLGESTYTVADLTFLEHMIVHHSQALELCGLVAGRSGRAELLAYVRYVHDAQQTEIEHMRGLLRQAAARGAALPARQLHGDPPMPGMLTRAQMADIAAARGARFEQLWLEGMILHHQGGVEMALAHQQAQHANGNQPWGVDILVDEMLTVQRAEITKMKQWLQEWEQT